MGTCSGAKEPVPNIFFGANGLTVGFDYNNLLIGNHKRIYSFIDSKGSIWEEKENDGTGKWGDGFWESDVC